VGTRFPKSMPSPNLDLVRSIYAGWQRGDFSSAEWADPEIEVVRPDGPEPGSWTGPDGMADGMRDFLNPWGDFRVEADEFRELDDERVLVLVRYGGRGKTTRLQVWSKAAHVHHVGGGKVTKLVLNSTADEHSPTSGSHRRATGPASNLKAESAHMAGPRTSPGETATYCLLQVVGTSYERSASRDPLAEIR
jgi:ketosteroid isomerase-like protein